MRSNVVCALLLATLSSAACTTKKTVTMDELNAMKPLKAWVTEKDQTVVLVSGPQVVGDTLVGYINGVYEEMPAAQLTQLMVETPAKTRTYLLVGGYHGCRGWNDLRAHWWEGRYSVRGPGLLRRAPRRPDLRLAMNTIGDRPMSLSSRSIQTLLRRTAAVASLCLLSTFATPAQAQVHMVVDSKGSLAWWQIDPNMAHLWGTTCPQEPSWRAGEGRSGGWTTEEASNAKTLAHGFNQKSDTINVPLYPRRRIRYVCSEALQGQVTLPDTVKWRGAQGQVTVRVKDIVTGESMRDKYEQDAVLSVAVYPDIKFTLDSIVNPSRKGDTTWAVGMGTWTLRGVTKPVMAGHQVVSRRRRCDAGACQVEDSGEIAGGRLRCLEANPGSRRHDGHLEEPVHGRGPGVAPREPGTDRAVNRFTCA